MSDFEIKQPTPEEIRALILKAGLKRAEASELLHASRRTWDKWTAKPDSKDNRAMPLAAWELLLIKVGKHPHYKKADEHS